jgi:hypothetical protein
MSSGMWNPVTGKLPTIHMHIAQKEAKGRMNAAKVILVIYV